MEIVTPAQLVTLLGQVSLQGKDKFELNRQLANHTRRFFRAQISAQRDINNTPYAPKKRRATVNSRGKVPNKNNMLMGMSRNLKTHIDEDEFHVGLAGLEGHIAKIHNEGKSVVYMRKINGWFNTKTNLWENGNKDTKSAYLMPKRTIVGWTPELQRQLTQIIIPYLQPKVRS